MKNKNTLRIYRNKKRELCWSFVASNGERVAQGEGYKRRRDVESGAALVLAGRPAKTLQDVLKRRQDITVLHDL